MSISSFQVGGVVIEVDKRKRVQLDDSAAYLDFVNRMATGACVQLTIEEEKPHRKKTWDQVKYWKGCVCPLVADHCGMSEKQADLALLGEKFGYIDTPNGHQLPKVTSISDLSVEEMTELISWALDWCPAELEIVLPKPDKDWKKHEATIRAQLRRPA